MLKEQYVASLIQIEEWFLETYEHGLFEGTRLKRIIENLSTRKYDLVFTGENIEIIKDSIRWAEGIDSGCPVASEIVQEIKSELGAN